MKNISCDSRKNKTISIFGNMNEEERQKVMDNIDKFKKELDNMFKYSFGIYKDKGADISGYHIETMNMDYFDAFGVSSLFDIGFEYEDGYFGSENDKLIIRFYYRRLNTSRNITSEEEEVYDGNDIKDCKKTDVRYLTIKDTIEHWIDVVKPTFEDFAEFFKNDMAIYEKMYHDYLIEHERFEIACSYSNHAKNDFVGVFENFPYEFLSTNPSLTTFSVVYDYSRKKFDRIYRTTIKFNIDDTARLYMKIRSTDTEYNITEASVLYQSGGKVKKFAIGMDVLDYSSKRKDEDIYSIKNRFLTANYRNNIEDIKAMYVYLTESIKEKMV